MENCWSIEHALGFFKLFIDGIWMIFLYSLHHFNLPTRFENTIFSTHKKIKIVKIISLPLVFTGSIQHLAEFSLIMTASFQSINERLLQPLLHRSVSTCCIIKVCSSKIDYLTTVLKRIFFKKLFSKLKRFVY